MATTATANPVRDDVLRDAARWLVLVRDAKLARYRELEGRGRGPADRAKANLLFTDVAELDGLLRRMHSELG